MAVMMLVGCGGTAPVFIIDVTTSATDPVALLVSTVACHRQPYKAVAEESSLRVRIALTVGFAASRREPEVTE